MKPTDRYETPQDLILALDRLFSFDLDAAAEESTAKCRRWFGPGSYLEVDALVLRDAFDGVSGLELNRIKLTIWCNRPYSHPYLKHFAKWCAGQKNRGHTVGMLCPYSPETGWWRQWVVGKAILVMEIHPRVQFFLDGVQKKGNKWPSAFVVWVPWADGPPTQRTWTWKSHESNGGLL